ncbi:hypothetical protein X975_15780, partial [Stegodyphus mimosarum]
WAKRRVLRFFADDSGFNARMVFETFGGQPKKEVFYCKTLICHFVQD